MPLHGEWLTRLRWVTDRYAVEPCGAFLGLSARVVGKVQARAGWAVVAGAAVVQSACAEWCLASLRGPARRGAGCLGGRGPAERAEGIGKLCEGGTRQRGPQQAVELAVEDGGGDAQEFCALGGQLHDR